MTHVKNKWQSRCKRLQRFSNWYTFGIKLVVAKSPSLLSLLILSSLASGLMACNKKLQSNLKITPPVSMVEPAAFKQPPAEAPHLDPAPSEPTEPAKPVVVQKPEPPEKVETKTEQPAAASNFIIATYNTMVHEGKKIGAACNFYVERVLEVLGFKTVDFLANDFDLAAQKIFKSYKVVMLTNVTELKRHLWSYRERTGFILQWERAGAPGHVAIVEGVGETIYIYQASLNKYTARVEKTTVVRLLQVNN
ncbi:MAG: hypothetical protein H7235_07930, partial [Bdellovibrionaceae bacterium]|nr:hypothetical protein [Pseudobdellovibrionaceae bacterium]